jgi:hypothetical protein
LQPARLLDGIGGIVIRLDVHALEQFDVACVVQQVGDQIIVLQIACIAGERHARIGEPRVVMRLRIPQMNVRVDNFHGASFVAGAYARRASRIS